ncbi:DUF4232 domain-containing protein [Streptomyces sp. NPDC057257]|uniref:DUF4232 domain-containing protein n=1 Tax=Streptomyces sp. NPDC057257 TaxID=3346071 RepID=UPI0036278993
MQYVNGIRKAALAIAALSAALTVTACQSGNSPTAADSPSKAPSSSATPSSTPSSPSPSGKPSSEAPSTAGTPTATASPISGGGGGGGTSKTCAPEALTVAAHQATDRPDGTGTGAAIIEFTNKSAKPCTLQGHPTLVAGAGNGSPDHNAPLKVTPTGTATPVTLAPGGTARLKLTFVQVQGEADGYCKSGAKPSSYPTLVVGLPGAGAHQVALDDGVFAECDNTVTATAVTATKLT